MKEKIIQISDLHFGTVVPDVVDALIKKINEMSPHLLVVSGDITQRSFDHQFKEAQQFLKKIDCQNRIIVPGNHDIPFYKFWHRFYRPDKTFSKFMKGFGGDSYVGNKIAVFGLNSCNPAHYKNGHFTHQHALAMTAFFASVPSDYKRVIVCHHPVDVLLDTDLENMMPESSEAIRKFEALHIDLIMAGHIHFPFCRSLKVRYPWLQRDIWVCQAGTATSHRIRSSMPNSFMVLHTDETYTSVKIEQWDYELSPREFRKAKEYNLFPFKM